MLVKASLPHTPKRPHEPASALKAIVGVQASLAMAEVQAALRARREKSLEEIKKKQEKGVKKRKELAEATAKNQRAAEEAEA
eukprot:1584941-Prymnesium_polylepis.1